MTRVSLPRGSQLPYASLLVVLSVVAFSFLALVINEFANGPKGEEFTGNVAFLVVFGGPPLIVGALAGLAFLTILQRRRVGRPAQIGWATTALIIGGAATWIYGRMEWYPVGLAVGLLLLGLGALVLVGSLRIHREEAERPG